MKKIFKFLSSRLLYLVIGIFLAVGATYVYATWDQAKTTSNPGQLTEANWNALVDMLQNSLGSTDSKCINTFGYCTVSCSKNEYGSWDCYPSDCSCTPANCPTGFTSLGVGAKYETGSYLGDSSSGSIYNCTRYCCK